MGPLNPSRDDELAPDHRLDHPRYGGFDSQFAGCAVAQEEAIRDFERVSGSGVRDDNRLDADDFDTAMIEGEAWADAEGAWLK